MSGLAPLMTGAEATWIASAISDGDRLAAGRGTMEAEGLRARLLAIDPEIYRQAYDLVSNETLWFIHHGLYDLPRAPAFNGEFRAAWLAYRRLNERFADAVRGLAQQICAARVMSAVRASIQASAVASKASSASRLARSPRTHRTGRWCWSRTTTWR